MRVEERCRISRLKTWSKTVWQVRSRFPGNKSSEGGEMIGSGVQKGHFRDGIILRHPQCGHRGS